MAQLQMGINNPSVLAKRFKGSPTTILVGFPSYIIRYKVMKMALYILSIFSTQPYVVMSWGVCKFAALQGDSGIIFHVQGYKFNGWVKVLYDEGSDLFNIIYLSNKGDTVNEQKGIYFDELVNTIDNYVENTQDYNKRVRKEYNIREVVLNQV